MLLASLPESKLEAGDEHGEPRGPCAVCPTKTTDEIVNKVPPWPLGGGLRPNAWRMISPRWSAAIGARNFAIRPSWLEHDRMRNVNVAFAGGFLMKRLALALIVSALVAGCTSAETAPEPDAEEAEAIQAATACCTGTWQMIDSAVAISDLNAFGTFTASNGYPLNTGEVLPYPSYRIGVVTEYGATQNVVQQYLAYKYPSLEYCEFFTVFEDDFCPPKGGVLWIQNAPQGSSMSGLLRSESDTNCAYSSACPTVTPGACWGKLFRSTTVKQIWVR
ncbi:hypothetical protein [Polyangium sp. 6x1]|uniref:hypothetical protein n=1 Tax=Polyangium sp. 6x1 TaxID=3042689 RepID=UPI002482C31B|nr:hypothetical protein [Polyangium sp. 6x1]MDI1452129.1 hypothetical protein [Polyangium sp. 6x1]